MGKIIQYAAAVAVKDHRKKNFMQSVAANSFHADKKFVILYGSDCKIVWR